MKRMCLSVSSFLALLVCVASFGVTSETHAQTRDKYLISATAGGINFVTGNVTVIRKGTNSQQAVTDRDNLESGDVVTTGMGGRVEVLLNPGSYMRVAENSEFVLTDTSLEHLRIRLTRGSAIIEVVGTDDTRLSLQVETPQTNTVIVKRGIYRLNVLPSGATEVLVRKGRALVGPMALEVKGGKMVVVSRSGMSEIAKIDKRALDSLELWSRDRAEYLASVNRRISPASTLINYSSDIWPTNSYRDRYAGAWVYDSQRGCYVFLPGRGGSSSPYGYGYRNWGRCCINGRGNETPSNVPPPRPQTGGNPVAGGNPPTDTPPPDGGQPREPGGNYRPSEGPDGGRGGNNAPISRPDSPAPVSRPEPSAPISRPESSPAPSYSPPPPSSPPPSSPPPSAPARMEAPAMRENPN